MIMRVNEDYRPTEAKTNTGEKGVVRDTNILRALGDANSNTMELEEANTFEILWQETEGELGSVNVH